MKKTVSVLAIAALGLISLSAHAQTAQKKAAGGVAKGESYVGKGLSAAGLDKQYMYAELGLSLLNYKISGTGISAKPLMLRAIAGYDYHPNLGLEAMLGLGLRGARGTGVYGGAYNVSAGTMIAAYAKPRIKLDGIEIFGRVGAVNTFSSVSGYSGTDGGASFSYGVGMSYMTQWEAMGNREISINGDFMSYYSGSGLKYNGITVGAGMQF